jgi:Na+-driven multidrug efflux pump
MLTATGFGIITTAIFTLMPELLVALFIDTSTHAAQIAIDGLPYFASGFIFFILNICLSGYYQSIERMKPATIIMLMRGLLFLLPCFHLLPTLIGTEGIWLATPLAEAVTLAIAVAGIRIKKGHL